MRFSGCQLNLPKLDTILKKLKTAHKTQFCSSLLNPHVQFIIERKHHSHKQKQLRPVPVSCI